MSFLIVVDILASAAAIVAIGTALFGWWRASRAPLTVKRVVVHQGSASTVFILIVKNVRPFPVVVSEIDCYTRKKYTVQRRDGGRPEYSVVLSSQHSVFTFRQSAEILPGGITDIRVPLPGTVAAPAALLFLMRTSHGYQELWCRDVETAQLGVAKTYRVTFRESYETLLRARLVYLWQLLAWRFWR